MITSSLSCSQVVASCSAVLLWFFLYRVVYLQPWSPGLPGAGPFKYIREYNPALKNNNVSALG
jgi:hypothetical protein